MRWAGQQCQPANMCSSRRHSMNLCPMSSVSNLACRFGNEDPAAQVATLEFKRRLNPYPICLRSELDRFETPRLDQFEDMLAADVPVLRQLAHGDERAGIRDEVSELILRLERHNEPVCRTRVRGPCHQPIRKHESRVTPVGVAQAKCNPQATLSLALMAKLSASAVRIR